MNTINWLTAEQVKAEAKKGPKEAMAVTKLHWLQLSEATLEQLEKQFESNRKLWYYIKNNLCGLCEYYNHYDSSGLTRKCPLFERSRLGNCKCCDEWMEVSKVIDLDKSIAEIYPDFHEKSGIFNKKIQGLE